MRLVKCEYERGGGLILNLDYIQSIEVMDDGKGEWKLYINENDQAIMRFGSKQEAERFLNNVFNNFGGLALDENSEIKNELWG